MPCTVLLLSYDRVMRRTRLPSVTNTCVARSRNTIGTPTNLHTCQQGVRSPSLTVLFLPMVTPEGDANFEMFLGPSS
jgi:hypothetical protein